MSDTLISFIDDKAIKFIVSGNRLLHVEDCEVVLALAQHILKDLYKHRQLRKPEMQAGKSKAIQRIFFPENYTL